MGKKKYAAPAPKSRLSRLGPIRYFPDFTNILSGFITILSAIFGLSSRRFPSPVRLSFIKTLFCCQKINKEFLFLFNFFLFLIFVGHLFGLYFLQFLRKGSSGIKSKQILTKGCTANAPVYIYSTALSIVKHLDDSALFLPSSPV